MTDNLITEVESSRIFCFDFKLKIGKFRTWKLKIVRWAINKSSILISINGLEDNLTTLPGVYADESN